MTYKESFLIYLLKKLFNEFINGKKFKNSQDIYDSIGYGDGIHDYIIVPSQYHYYDLFNKLHGTGKSYGRDLKKGITYEFNFDIHKINNDSYIKSIENNIWKYFYKISHNTYLNYNEESWIYHQASDTIDELPWINIDNQCWCDSDEENKINVELYSIREACDTNHNNEYYTIKKNYIYSCSAKIFDNEVLLISKSYIYKGLKDYVELLLSNEPKNFNEEVFQEFLKILHFDDNYTYFVDKDNYEIFEL